MKLSGIKIDQEFEALLRKQSEIEATEMAASIRQFGYLTDLVIWEGQDILVDGHSRFRHFEAAMLEYQALYEAWKIEHAAWLKNRPSIMARVVVKDTPEPVQPKHPAEPGFIKRPFADREAVIQFIRELQASRRNLTQNELTEMLGVKFNELADALGSANAAAVQVAETQGLSVSTVVRAGQYADSVATLRRYIEDLDARLNSDDAPSQKDVNDLAKLLDYAKEAGVTITTSEGSTMTPEQLLAWNKSQKEAKRAEGKRMKEEAKRVAKEQVKPPVLVAAHERAAPFTSTPPATDMRLDAAHESLPSPPTWQDHLASLTIALEALLADSVDEERKAVKKQVNLFVKKVNNMLDSQKQTSA